MMRAGSALAFALAAVLGAWSPATAAQAKNPPTAGQIFDRALGFVRSQHYPPYLSFVVTVRSPVKNRWLVEQFQSMCRTRDDRVVTYSKPVSTTNQPDNPYKFTLKLKGVAVHDSPDIDEPFGLPEMSPVYTFGMLALRPSSSTAREYDVSLAGQEQLRGRKVYHLMLAPVSEPLHNRVRELWVDAETFAVWQIVSAGVFSSGKATTVPWTISYTINRGRWLIDSEWTTASMLLGGYAPAVNQYVNVPGATKYDGVTYTFSNVEPAAQTHDFMFFEFKPSQAIQM
jgi:hypothetical protein